MIHQRFEFEDSMDFPIKPDSGQSRNHSSHHIDTVAYTGVRDEIDPNKVHHIREDLEWLGRQAVVETVFSEPQKFN